MDLYELIAYLDDYLRVREVPDHPGAFNGLQIDGRRPVRRVALAVDACRYTAEAAIREEADVLIVHHGLFWGQSAPITGALYRRVEPLIRNGVALYSCHLPLDVHPECGNNAVLCRKLGLRITGSFGIVQGVSAGIIAEAETTGERLRETLDAVLGTNTRWIAGSARQLRRVGILTGSGAEYAAEAAAAGCDALITGEGSHHSYLVAEESGIHVFLAGHYATETCGIRALQDHIRMRLDLDTVFLDHPTGM